MFGLGNPFTVYSAESEGWLIQKPCYNGPGDTCFAFATTGEVYIGAELEQCLHQMTLSLFMEMRII